MGVHGERLQFNLAGGCCPLELEQTMTEKTEIMEFADKTVDRAVEEACRHFDVDRDQLNIKLITRGSTGLFGLGGRKAKIAASLKKETVTDKEIPVPESGKEPVAILQESDNEEKSRPEAVADMEEVQEDDAAGSGMPGSAESSDLPENADEQEIRAEDRDAETVSVHGEKESAEPDAENTVSVEDESRELSEEVLERLERARVFAAQLLDKAGLDSIVQVNPDPANPSLNISGEDISLIIGKDGHTLDAIEYIVNLNIKRSEERGGRRIPVDAQGYRAKRDEGLRRTAEKLALKARKTRRSVAMAPMNSRERRIVHMAVKSMGGLRTHSTGDGRLRKVIITPAKKNGNHHRQGRRHNRR